MKKKSIQGDFEWDSNCEALIFVDVFLKCCEALRKGKKPNYVIAQQYGLTTYEFNALLGKAEMEVNSYKG